MSVCIGVYKINKKKGGGHRFIVVIDSFCMTKINSLPSANEHEKLGANQGSTSDLFLEWQPAASPLQRTSNRP